MQPLVSILIPCFNADRWIAQAIDSALAQTWVAKEVIVVDDGSSDRSLDIIQSFGSRIRSEAGKHRGGNETRNRLLRLARGEWVQYLDADDYLRPAKIERQIEFLHKNGECDVICSATASELMENGQIRCQEHEIPFPRDSWILLAHWDLPQTAGPLWRKSSLESVGGWRIDLPCCQEHELYLRLLETGARFAFCDCCLSVYRQWDHGGRLSDRISRAVFHRQRLSIMDRIEAHLNKHTALTPVHRAAVNDTRHATARTVWNENRLWAREIVMRIQESDPGYVPRGQPASPPLYSAAYRLFGFEAAQALASRKRALTSTMRFALGGKLGLRPHQMHADDL